MNEQELVERSATILAEHGLDEQVLAAGIFNLRGYTGAMFLAGIAGDAAGAQAARVLASTPPDPRGPSASVNRGPTESDCRG